MAERNAPQAPPPIGRERRLDELPVLGIFEQAVPTEKILPSRYRGTRTRCWIRSGSDRTIPDRMRRGRRPLSSGHPFAQVEVVFDLRAIVPLFCLVGVVVPNRGKHGHAVDHIAIGLEVGEEPVVVFVSAAANRNAQQPRAGVDVVAGGEDQRGRPACRSCGESRLPPSAVCASASPSSRRRRSRPSPRSSRRRRRAQWDRGSCRTGCRSCRPPGRARCPARTSPSARRPPTLRSSRTLCRCIRCRASGRAPSNDSRPRSSPRGKDTRLVVDLDPRRPIGRRQRADGILARRVDVLQILVVDDLPLAAARGAEVERAPGHQCRLVGDGGR